MSGLYQSVIVVTHSLSFSMLKRTKKLVCRYFLTLKKHLKLGTKKTRTYHLHSAFKSFYQPKT